MAQKVPQNPSEPTIRPQLEVLENTLTAKKMSVHEKFEFRVIETFGIRGLLGSAVGYGLQYGSSFGNAVSRQVFAFTLDSALHEDSRYFPSNEHGFGRRLKNIGKQVFRQKG